MKTNDTSATFTRRSMIAAGAILGAAAASQVRAAIPNGPSPTVTPGFATVINSELQQLSPNCFAFLQREQPGQSNLSVANFGVVVGPTSLLAIDAGGGPAHARNFMAAIKRFNKPIDRLVITHEHPDHIQGMLAFPDGIEVVAQAETRSQMTKMSAATPALWKTNPAWGLPSDVAKIVMPSVTFTDKMTVYYGDTVVDFIWPGRAHTSGDALIHLPKEKIIFMGDIAFFNVTPLNGSGFVQDWIKVCDRIIADPNVETIVPGHGPVGGKAQLAEMRDYLALLLAAGRKAKAAGVSPGRAAAEMDLGKYARWTDSNRVANNMFRLYSELDGNIGVDTDRAGAAAALAEYNALTKKP